MGLRINTNVQSLSAQRSLNNVVEENSTTLARLSSGDRITTAGDDAAGLAISENLKAEIRSTKQASRNAGDGISLIQTAEGGLNEVSNILIRLRELSVQAASDTIGDTERGFSDLEFQNLVQEVDRISASTKFNGQQLLNGEGETIDIQIGTSNDEFRDRLSFDVASSNATAADIGIEGLSVASKPNAQENLNHLDTAISKINANRANLGAVQNRLQSTISNLEIQSENLSAANSRIRDTDMASAASNNAKNNILLASGSSVLAQTNNLGSQALKLIG